MSGYQAVKVKKARYSAPTAAPTAAPPERRVANQTDLKAKSEWGQQGAFFDEAQAAFSRIGEALARHRYRRSHGDPGLWPPEPEPDEKYGYEQTPFGKVRTKDAPGNDYTDNGGRKVKFIETEDTAFPGSEGGLKNYIHYRSLAKKLTPAMADMVLAEVYTTLGRYADANRETTAARQERCEAARADYADEDPTERRKMAVLYALCLFSEEQRNAGGKPMRAALKLVAAGVPPEQLFIKGEGGHPDYMQAEKLVWDRHGKRGGRKPSAGAKRVSDEMSGDSDREDKDRAGKAKRYLEKAAAHRAKRARKKGSKRKRENTDYHSGIRTKRSKTSTVGEAESPAPPAEPYRMPAKRRRDDEPASYQPRPTKKQRMLDGEELAEAESHRRGATHTRATPRSGDD
jgi:hypothetical protein